MKIMTSTGYINTGFFRTSWPKADPTMCSACKKNPKAVSETGKTRSYCKECERLYRNPPTICAKCKINPREHPDHPKKYYCIQCRREANKINQRKYYARNNIRRI